MRPRPSGLLYVFSLEYSFPCPVPGLIGPCHIFRGSKTTDGYGQVGYKGKLRRHVSGLRFGNAVFKRNCIYQDRERAGRRIKRRREIKIHVASDAACRAGRPDATGSAASARAALATRTTRAARSSSGRTRRASTATSARSPCSTAPAGSSRSSRRPNAAGAACAASRSAAAGPARAAACASPSRRRTSRSCATAPASSA